MFMFHYLYMIAVFSADIKGFPLCSIPCGYHGALAPVSSRWTSERRQCIKYFTNPNRFDKIDRNNTMFVNCRERSWIQTKRHVVFVVFLFSFLFYFLFSFFFLLPLLFLCFVLRLLLFLPLLLLVFFVFFFIFRFLLCCHVWVHHHGVWMWCRCRTCKRTVQRKSWRMSRVV